jgi:hypothetical protein
LQFHCTFALHRLRSKQSSYWSRSWKAWEVEMPMPKFCIRQLGRVWWLRLCMLICLQKKWLVRKTYWDLNQTFLRASHTTNSDLTCTLM